MERGQTGYQRSGKTLALGLIAVPVAAFYFLLARTLVDLPFFDDYESVLRFLNVFSQRSGTWPRIRWILAFQHVEYRLIFESAVFATVYLLKRRVDFLFLSVLGDLFVAALAAVVLVMWRQVAGANRRLLLFVPVAYLIFQLQYASTLNWAMGSLQNIPVLFFSFLAIYLLTREDRLSYIAACVSHLLAIASSGNGFLLAPIGIAILMQSRRRARLVFWAAASVAVAALYFHSYDFSLSQDNAIGAAPHSLSVTYALSFLGASAGRLSSVVPSALLGLGLCGVLVHAFSKGYNRSSPALFYCLLFLVITAFAVSYLRSGEGVSQSLASRYRIYSNLAVAFAYLYLADSLVLSGKVPLNTRAFAVVLGLAMIFCALSDAAGYRLLRDRREILTMEMARWRSGEASAPPGSVSNPMMQRGLREGIYRPIGPTLERSMELGIYSPPVLPAR